MKTTGITKGDRATKIHAKASSIFRRDGKILITVVGNGNMCYSSSIERVSVNEFMKFRKEAGDDFVCANCLKKIKDALKNAQK